MYIVFNAVIELFNYTLSGDVLGGENLYRWIGSVQQGPTTTSSSSSSAVVTARSALTGGYTGMPIGINMRNRSLQEQAPMCQVPFEILSIFLKCIDLKSVICLSRTCKFFAPVSYGLCNLISNGVNVFSSLSTKEQKEYDAVKLNTCLQIIEANPDLENLQFNHASSYGIRNPSETAWVVASLKKLSKLQSFSLGLIPSALVKPICSLLEQNPNLKVLDLRCSERHVSDIELGDPYLPDLFKFLTPEVDKDMHALEKLYILGTHSDCYLTEETFHIIDACLQGNSNLENIVIAVPVGMSAFLFDKLLPLVKKYPQRITLEFFLDMACYDDVACYLSTLFDREDPLGLKIILKDPSNTLENSNDPDIILIKQLAAKFPDQITLIIEE